MRKFFLFHLILLFVMAAFSIIEASYSVKIVVKHPFIVERCDTLGNIVSDSLARFLAIRPTIYRSNWESLFIDDTTNDSGYAIISFDKWKDGIDLLIGDLSASKKILKLK
jgi:hypothetical protein